jgi:cellulose synthase/poly-beta-1,6-N-acetylglucosamine synthase-like glycosyltransferase
MILKILFWFFLSIILYTYVGYTLILVAATGIKKLFGPSGKRHPESYEPFITLIIPAYNEEQFVVEKVNNTESLVYPKNKLQVIWITDGSNDRTHELLSSYSGITVMHESERHGKAHAMNRAMSRVNTPLVVFTDANTMLNSQTLIEIVKPFADPETGCVTGEKRVRSEGKQKAVGAGEGLYWQYESLIKYWESETGSVMGAVGEIFAIRSELYEDLPDDTLLDDFTLSMQIARKGFAVKYAPRAWGTETASLSVAEEIKRKIRIAAGGMQTLTRMKDLLHAKKHVFLTFKYISHKVLRWTLLPFSFPVIFLLNLFILFQPGYGHIYITIFILQCLFYLLAIAGGLMQNSRTRARILFAPYYLMLMNHAILKGLFRFITGNYSVNWQKVKRS